MVCGGGLGLVLLCVALFDAGLVVGVDVLLGWDREILLVVLITLTPPSSWTGTISILPARTVVAGPPPG